MVAEGLRRRGHEVVPAVWNEPGSVDNAEAVVIRSCWDYHLHVDDFLSWVDSIRVPLMNAPALVRWNARKTYLLELAERLEVVPTRFVADGVVDDELFATLAAELLVVKPVVGASAYGTRVITRTDRASLTNVLVQPYMEEIRSGEWSIILFDGIVSHTILKQPSTDDFRVQRELGGSAVPAEAPAAVLDLAHRVIATLPVMPAYARVDAIVTESGPKLMELELIEPELFVTLAPASVDFFCDAIERRLP